MGQDATLRKNRPTNRIVLIDPKSFTKPILRANA